MLNMIIWILIPLFQQSIAVNTNKFVNWQGFACNGNIIQSFSARSKTNCALHCLRDYSHCKIFTYATSNNLCKLFESAEFTDTMVNDCYIKSEKIEVHSASQSSVAYGGEAIKAVDGNYNGHYFEGNSCTHTVLEEGAWWRADLQAARTIVGIKIWNRTDNVGSRLSNFTIFAGNNVQHTNNSVCYHYEGTAGEIADITCDSVLIGRYVTVNLLGMNFFSLCEVEIYGSLNI